jgi:hypothetical protein
MHLRAGTNRWGEQLHKHNDPDDRFHLSLLEYVVIGRDIQAAFGIV